MVTELGTFALIAKVALVAPAGTFTTLGTRAALAGSAASETAAPSAGAAMFRVTVPCNAWPSVTLAELRLTEDSSKGDSWAQTVLTTPRLISSERSTVPITRIRLFDLV